MQITKIKKYFHKQTLILNQVIVFLFYFLKSNINQINKKLIKNLFSKTNKKHKTNQMSISTPNYEVLIPHGYVGKGHSSIRINKKCR